MPANVRISEDWDANLSNHLQFRRKLRIRNWFFFLLAIAATTFRLVVVLE